MTRFRAALLAFALLCAQHAALAHALWHAGAEGAPDEGQAQLCQLHAALGTVCAVADTAGASPCALEIEQSVPEARCVPGPSLPAPTPASRGPPAPL